MTTLSQIVREVAQETKRAGMTNELVSYANQVVRELHSNPSTDNVLLYPANMKEDIIVPDAEYDTYVWTIPTAHLYQNTNAVFYSDLGIFAEEVTPRAIANCLDPHYYYRSGDSLVFAGFGAEIKIAYYLYPKGLTYYNEGDAPALWDAVAQNWAYHADYIGNEATALGLVTNWLFQRHAELIKQGIRSKVYARLADIDRARSAYAMYMQARKMMAMAELGDNNIHYG